MCCSRAEGVAAELIYSWMDGLLASTNAPGSIILLTVGTLALYIVVARGQGGEGEREQGDKGGTRSTSEVTP